MMQDVLAWRKARRKQSEAKQFLRETEKLVRRAGKQLDGEARQNIERGQGQLRQALGSGDTVSIEQSAKTLDDMVHRYLGKFKKSHAREYFESIGFAILVALTLRAFVVEAFKIPSGSMIPTLEIGDQIFVNKFIYGLRIPFTFIKFFEFRQPQRGEVIVFIYPRNHDQDFIKRVIGVPGDTIEVRDEQLIINGQPVPREKQTGPCESWERSPMRDVWESTRCEGYTETVGGIAHTMIVSAEAQNRRQDFGPETVKPGHLFVMGDNRDNSSDSRVWGQVPLENVKGRAMFIWWAWSKDGINFGRFFHWIH